MRFEIWRSDQNKKEIHFFEKDSANTYIFGVNPAFISHDVVERLLGEPLPDEALEAWE